MESMNKSKNMSIIRRFWIISMIRLVMLVRLQPPWVKRSVVTARLKMWKAKTVYGCHVLHVVGTIKIQNNNMNTWILQKKFEIFGVFFLLFTVMVFFLKSLKIPRATNEWKCLKTTIQPCFFLLFWEGVQKKILGVINPKPNLNGKNKCFLEK